MGEYTRDEFIAEAIAQTGVGTTHPVYTETRFGKWFLATYRHVTMPNVFMHPELETTEYVALSSSSNKITLANEYRKVYSVAIVEEAYTAPTVPGVTARRHRLRQVLPRALDAMKLQSRRPTHYAHWARLLELNAVPDATTATYSIQVRGYKIPADIGASGETLISADWDDVIIAGMVHRYWLAAQQDDKIETTREDYWRLITERGGFHIQSSDDLEHSMEIASETIDWRQSGNG
jgi:hypothetical protein